MQCAGRLVNDSKGEWALPFDGVQEFFHLPIRCKTIASASSDLCEKCQQREFRTQQKVAALRGNHSIQASHPALLHGRIEEPIPFWSHVYDGSWFRLKIEQGYTVSESNMGKAKKAEAMASGSVVVEPEPFPGGIPQKGRKKKVAAALEQTNLKEFLTPSIPAKKTPKKAVVVEAHVQLSPEVKPSPPTLPPKKRAPKQTLQPQLAPVALVSPNEQILVEEIINIQVKKLEIDGKSYYLDRKKDKIYNLQFKYVGRYDKQAKALLTGFHDSDQE